MKYILRAAAALLLAGSTVLTAEAGHIKGEPGRGKSAVTASVQNEKKGSAAWEERVSAGGPSIEVGLQSGTSLSITGIEGFTAETAGKKWQTFKKGEAVRISAAGSSISINGKKAAGPVYFRGGKKGAAFSVKGNVYRGDMKLIPSGAGVTVVNVLPLEDYLLGVVPKEVSPSWEKEALKAQAVAARTYAVYHKGAFRSRGYDVTDDTRSQVYGGYSAEAAATNAAVRETKGEVITYGGRPIEALFHANGGGYTENSENVWGSAVPYLKGVAEPKSSVTGRAWTKTISTNSFASMAGVGKLKRIELSALKKAPMKKKDRGISGRVKYMVVSGSKGTATLTGERLQSMLGLSSTLFDVAVKGKNLVITGYGAGHGLGLSQWGAEAMAEENKGKTDFYKTIVTHYFTGTKVEKIY